MSDIRQFCATAFATLLISTQSFAQEAQSIAIKINHEGVVRTFQLPVLPSEEVVKDERVVVSPRQKGTCNFVLLESPKPYLTGLYFRGRASAGATQAQVEIEYSNHELVEWNKMDTGSGCTIEMPSGVGAVNGQPDRYVFLVKKGAPPEIVSSAENNKARVHNVEITAVWN